MSRVAGKLSRVRKIELLWFPSLLLFQNKTNKAKTDNNLSKFKDILQDLIREDLCDEDDISASQEHNTPGSPKPYDRHNASVSQTAKSAGTREGRYRPTCHVVKALSIGYKRQNESRKSSR